MARDYRKVSAAEERLLTAKGILDNLSTDVPTSAWYACGRLAVLVDDAIAYLAATPSAGSVQAYVAGAEAMEGYVQDALFGGEDRV